MFLPDPDPRFYADPDPGPHDNFCSDPHQCESETLVSSCKVCVALQTDEKGQLDVLVNNAYAGVDTIFSVSRLIMYNIDGVKKKKMNF